jgi:ATP-dependent Clp protease adapter protein ClpS
VLLSNEFEEWDKELDFEIAEVKAVESTQLARTNGYPLQIKLEEE